MNDRNRTYHDVGGSYAKSETARPLFPLSVDLVLLTEEEREWLEAMRWAHGQMQWGARGRKERR